MSEFFPGVPKIQYGGPKSRNPLEFKHYNPDEVVGGRTLKDHLRFSVVYWHTLFEPALRPLRSRHGRSALGRRLELRRKRRNARPRWRSSSSRSSAPRSMPSTIATSPPKARRSRKATPISTTWSRSSRTSKRGPASSCSGAPRTCSATPATCTVRRPARTSTPLLSPPRKSRRRWRLRTSSNGAGLHLLGRSRRLLRRFSTPT